MWMRGIEYRWSEGWGHGWGAQDLRMKAGILLVAMDLVVSSPSSIYCVPLVVMSRGAMVGKGLCDMLFGRLFVCTDWKCVSICSSCFGVVIKVLVLSFNDVILLVS